MRPQQADLALLSCISCKVHCSELKAVSFFCYSDSDKRENSNETDTTPSGFCKELESHVVTEAPFMSMTDVKKLYSRYN